MYINKKLTSLFAAIILLSGSCTTESREGGDGTPLPPGPGNNERREVLLTFRNELRPGSATKADNPIATPEENALSSPDVYVFAADKEGSDHYTFLQRFAYRADTDATLPEGSEELQLAAGSDNGKTTTGLLRIKKGLFVKLYCIANNTTLIDPATGEDTPLTDNAFTPRTNRGKHIQNTSHRLAFGYR